MDKKVNVVFPGLCKKVDKLASRKYYKDVGQWRNSICNHMYWCAASTPDGDEDTMMEKWKMIPLHMQNIHVNPASSIHKECCHGTLQGMQETDDGLHLVYTTY